jgi:hypothetical protein
MRAEKQWMSDHRRSTTQSSKSNYAPDVYSHNHGETHPKIVLIMTSGSDGESPWNMNFGSSQCLSLPLSSKKRLVNEFEVDGRSVPIAWRRVIQCSDSQCRLVARESDSLHASRQVSLTTAPDMGTESDDYSDLSYPGFRMRFCSESTSSRALLSSAKSKVSWQSPSIQLKEVPSGLCDCVTRFFGKLRWFFRRRSK